MKKFTEVLDTTKEAFEVIRNALVRYSWVILVERPTEHDIDFDPRNFKARCLELFPHADEVIGFWDNTILVCLNDDEWGMAYRLKHA